MAIYWHNWRTVTLLSALALGMAHGMAASAGLGVVQLDGVLHRGILWCGPLVGYTPPAPDHDGLSAGGIYELDPVAQIVASLPSRHRPTGICNEQDLLFLANGSREQPAFHLAHTITLQTHCHSDKP